MFKNISIKKILTVFFRIILILTILEVGLRASGYVRLLYQDHYNKISQIQGDTYKILILGDSMTNGDGASWGNELERILNTKSPNIKFKVIIEAEPGYISSYLSSNLENYLDSYKPNLVVTMIGINDPQALGTAQNNPSLIFKKFKVYGLSSYAVSSFVSRLKELQFFSNETLINEKDEQIELNIQDEIGEYPLTNKNFKEIEAALKKLIEKNPNKNNNSQFELARLYLDFYGSKDTLKLFDEYAGKSPHSYDVDTGFFDLGWYYLTNDRANDSEQLFNIIRKYSSRKLVLEFTEIGLRYKSANMENEAQEYFEKAAKIRKDYYNPITEVNYQKIYGILNKKKIRLIAVQYPTLDLDELKTLFKGDEDIIFLSNEENFKKELERANYDELFRGNDFATFGHLTGKGANMVAENVANATLKYLGINNK